MLSVRPAAVAGFFYPARREELTRMLDSMLAAAPAAATQASDLPKAVIAPHAGYRYSGPIAASIYAPLTAARERIKRVILLGPTHRVRLRGLALPGAKSFETPLGAVRIDAEAVATISKFPFVVTSNEAHKLEHSLEVHVPFLQTVLKAFTLVPLAVGHSSAEEVAAVLESLWDGDETLIVISSDLSHYLAYKEAQKIDNATAQAILALRTDISHHQACGATPVIGLNLVAQRRKLEPRLIDLRNSGDTCGDKSRVVGYGSFAFYEHAATAH